MGLKVAFESRSEDLVPRGSSKNLPLSLAPKKLGSFP